MSSYEALARLSAVLALPLATRDQIDAARCPKAVLAVDMNAETLAARCPTSTGFMMAHQTMKAVAAHPATALRSRTPRTQAAMLAILTLLAYSVMR